MRYILNFFFSNFTYLFIYGCVGSSFLCEGFLQLRQVEATLHRSAQASHYRGLSCCGAQAPDVQAQQLWLTGLVAPRHVGSSQTRARTHVPCIGRQILNHCATREAPIFLFLVVAFLLCLEKFLQHLLKAGLVVLNSFSFCLSVKLLISPSNLNESLAGQSSLGCRVFPFITLKISCHSPGLQSSCRKIC